MSPEPVPCNRKDYFFKDHRKHERGSSVASAGDGFGGGSAPSMNSRWRDPYHYPQRDFRGPSPRRPPPGHYRQGGGYHSVYSPDSGSYGCTPSRSDKFWSEDESFRPSSSRYGGSGRSSSGGFGNRDGYGSIRRSPYRDAGEFSRSQHRNGYHASAAVPKSVVVPISTASHPPSKDQNDKTATGSSGDGGVGGDDNCLNTGQKFDQRESPLGSISSWKSKWSRQSSVSATTKSGETEAKEPTFDVLVASEKETPLRSPVSSPLPSEDGLPKKKPRLGWGQGLAKYEKQKVEGSLDASSSGAKGSVCEMSPRIVGLPGSLSPATPCSAACTYQGGEVFMPFKAMAEDKTSMQVLDGEQATYHKSEISETDPLICSEELPFKLDDLEISSIDKLASLLADLLQPEDLCYGDSVHTSHSVTSKLQTIKDHISKELEKTECEIDLFETELRSLDTKSENIPSHCPSKLAVYSASDLGTHASSDHSLPVDNADDETVSNQLQCSDSVELDSEVKNPDDTSKYKMLPRLNQMKYLANKSESDKDVGACSAIDMPVGFMDAESEQTEQLEVHDTGSMGLASKLSAAEEDPIGSNTSSIAWSDGEEPNLVKIVRSTSLDISKQFLKELNIHSPIDLPKSDIWGLDKLSACRKNYTRVKKKIAAKKRWLKFKEKVLTLKFRALNQLWKEDLRLLLLRKQRQKSSKRVDINNRSLLHGSQKQRSALRSRFALPAGNFGLVPTTQIMDFTSKILADSEIKLYRQNLKMPALILDDDERRCSRFITNNGLVDDPVNYEKEKEKINPWSQEEKEVFMEMLATFGKDFSKISSFLSHKTTADCINFYYKNHKSESFEEVKKKLDLRKQRCAQPANTFMVTSQQKWNVDANAASLDILGAASFVAAHNQGTLKSQKQYGKTICRTYTDWKVSNGSCDYPETSNGHDSSDNDRETVAADVLAGICGSISSEAMSSCITSSIDRGEKKKLMPVDQTFTVEVTQSLDEDICSDEDCGEMYSSAWSDEEKSSLIRALSLYGKDFDAIAACVRTRTREQCKIFFSKARKCLGLDNIHQDNVIVGVPHCETNGGRSDTDDACAGEMESAICSTQSCSKLEPDVSPLASNNEESTCGGSASPNVENDKSNEQQICGVIVKDDQKVEREVPSLEDDNLNCQGSNSPLVMLSKESKDYAQTSNENLLCVEVADPAHTKIEAVGSGLTAKPDEPVTSSFLEANSKPIVASTSIHLEGTFGDSPVVEHKKGVDSMVLPVTDTGLVNRQQTKIDFSGNIGSSICFAFEPTNGSALVQGNKVGGLHARIGLLPYQRKSQLNPRSSMASKQQSFLSMQESGHSLNLTSFLQDSSISFGGQVDVASKSTLNFKEHGSKQSQNVPNRDLYQSKSNSSLHQTDGQFQIIRGYPLQMLSQRDIKAEGNPLTEKTVLFENYSKKNGFPQSNGCFLSASQGNNGDSVGLSDTVASLICSSRSENQSDSQSLSSAQRTSVAEEHRTGDVKLFGKIITHSSSVPRSSSSKHDNKSKPPSPKVTGSLLPSSTGKDVFACRPGDGSHIVREEIPISFGFWDGSRIQTGLTTVPDSSVMLAKYPTSVTGLSFYSSKDNLIGNGLLTDYPQSYIQNLSSDGKRVENFTELQKLNGRGDMFSGFQQQRRMAGHLGTNIIGDEILVGSEEVSDPVKALKLHYAARAKVEVDSWRTDIR